MVRNSRLVCLHLSSSGHLLHGVVLCGKVRLDVLLRVGLAGDIVEAETALFSFR